MNTVDKKFKEYTKKSVNKEPSILKLKQFKLNTILQNNMIDKIDYLNIDVEGHEYEVISGFNIKKYLPELVSIEIHDKNCPPINNKIYKYFIKNNYKLISIYGWTYFFFLVKILILFISIPKEKLMSKSSYFFYIFLTTYKTTNFFV